MSLKTEMVNIDAAGNIGVFATEQVGGAKPANLQREPVNVDEQGNIGVFFPNVSTAKFA